MKDFGAFLKTLTTHDPQGKPFATIADLAEYRRNLASQSDTSEAAHGAYDRQGKPAKHVAPWVVDPTTLDGMEIPERRWIVKDWLPVGYATLLYGDGGTGKTLLAQQLLTACAVGGSWLGMTVAKCKTYAFFCEDDEDEIHLRQTAINARLGIGFQDIGSMRWACPIGQDNALIRFARGGQPELTDRFRWLREEILSFGARLAVIDTAATTFGGNEIDRGQVSAYVGQALTRLAQDMDGAVLLNAHPSRAGKASGSGDSGSTAWSASARSRWSLTRPQAAEGGTDQNARLLTRMKANGAGMGDAIALRWQDWFLDLPGAVALGGVPEPFAGTNRRMSADQQFLALLARCDASNMPVSATRSSSNHAAKVFAKRSDADGFGMQEFEAAMHRLLTDGRIVLINYGRQGDERRRIALAIDAGAAEGVPDDDLS